LLFIELTSAAPAHDFHLSRTTLRYLADRDQVQVEMHVFLDDLELALHEAGAPNLRLGTEREDSSASRYLEAYLDRNFKIFWSGEELDSELVGYEISDDLQALWIYIAAEPEAPPRSIAVQQSVLTEVYDDQKNLVQVELGTFGAFNLLLDAAKIKAERQL
ncbi:MAG: DUF6702 family protein, partial [Bacteroidota bacterium]